jgi:transposase
MYYLGIDISKKAARCVFLDNNGERWQRAFTISPTTEELERLMERFKKFAVTPDTLTIGIEATGHWWENVYTALTDKGFTVIVLNPCQTKRYREALNFKAKTDDIDAYVIAGLIRSQDYAASFIPKEDIQVLREITKLRYQLMKNHKNYQRQTASLLALVFPEYQHTALKNPFAIASLAILKKYPTAKHLATAHPKQIEKIVRSIQGNNFNITDISELITTAQKSFYSGRASQDRGRNLVMLLSHIELLNHSLEDLEKRMEDILSPRDPDDLNSFPGSNILGIPGIGPKTVAAILSAVGADGTSFASATKIIGHVGFYPKIHESGQKKKENKIAKRGPKYLRAALYMAAVASVKHNPELRALYHKKLSQNKQKSQALIYVAKKIAHMCLSMLKSGQTYNPRRVFMPA